MFQEKYISGKGGTKVYIHDIVTYSLKFSPSLWTFLQYAIASPALICYPKIRYPYYIVGSTLDSSFFFFFFCLSDFPFFIWN